MKEKPTFLLLLFKFFPTDRVLKKIGIDMDMIDLSCHPKFGIKSRLEAEILRTKLEIWKKSQLTRSQFTHAQS